MSGAPCIEGKVKKANHAHPIGMLDAQYLFGQISLQETDQSSSHDHHDQQGRAYVGMLTQIGNCNSENAWPQCAAKQSDCNEGIGTGHSTSKNANDE
jgi:hypothetical protein